MISKEVLKKGGAKLSPGDIFEAPLAKNAKGYLQFIGKDDEYMAGHLIAHLTAPRRLQRHRAFKR